MIEKRGEEEILQRIYSMYVYERLYEAYLEIRFSFTYNVIFYPLTKTFSYIYSLLYCHRNLIRKNLLNYSLRLIHN